MMIVVVVGAGVGPWPPLQDAAAQSGERAVILSPYRVNARFAAPGEAPNVHAGSGVWNVDVYAGVADVYPRVVGVTGQLRMTATQSPACGTTGTTVTVNIAVDGVALGSIRYTHLDDVRLPANGVVTPNTRIGRTRLWTPSRQFDGPANRRFLCWSVSSLGGVHTHLSAFGNNCYAGLSLGSSISPQTAIGALGTGISPGARCTGQQLSTSGASPSNGWLVKTSGNNTVWAYAAGARWGIGSPAELQRLAATGYYEDSVRNVSSFAGFGSRAPDENRFIRVNRENTVYLYRAGTLWSIGNPAELTALQREVTADDRVHLIPGEAGHVEAVGRRTPPNNTFFRVRGRNTIYLYTAGSLWSIASPSEVEALQREVTANDAVHVIPASPNHVAALGERQLANNTLVRIRDSNTVYLHNAGTLWSVPGPSELRALRDEVTTDDAVYVLPARAGHLEAIGTDPPAGTLIVDRGTTVVYEIDNGTKRRVGTTTTVRGEITVPQGTAARFPTAPTNPDAPTEPSPSDPSGPSDPGGERSPSAPSSPAQVGYWMGDAGGELYGFGDATDPGSVPGRVVASASTPDGSGLWVLTADGVVHALAGAAHHGDVDAGSLGAGEVPATISVLPDGSGYWVFTNRGRAISFGAAPELEDLIDLGLGDSLNGPIIASVATATGQGAYMVGFDGGVFAVGDAVFHGSMGGQVLNGPVVGIATDPDRTGYWLVADDGGIFAFEAEFQGSMGGQLLNAPVVGAVPFGDGYLMVASDGGVFNFSDQEFLGSLGGNPPPDPVTTITGYPT